MGMPTYKGTNPRRAPSAVSFVMFIFKRCVVISCPLGPHRMLSSAAHVINIGESGPVQLACAFRVLRQSTSALMGDPDSYPRVFQIQNAIPGSVWVSATG